MAASASASASSSSLSLSGRRRFGLRREAGVRRRGPVRPPAAAAPPVLLRDQRLHPVLVALVQRVGVLLVQVPADRRLGHIDQFGRHLPLGRLVVGAGRGKRPPHDRQPQPAAIGLDQQHALAFAVRRKGDRVAAGAPHRLTQRVERLGRNRAVRIDVVAGADARALDRIAADEMGQVDDPAAPGQQRLELAVDRRGRRHQAHRAGDQRQSQNDIPDGFGPDGFAHSFPRRGGNARN